MLTADRVLVIVGTPCSMSAVGSTETYEARVAGSSTFIQHAAFDAGLVDFEPDIAAEDGFRICWRDGTSKGRAAQVHTWNGGHRCGRSESAES